MELHEDRTPFTLASFVLALCILGIISTYAFAPLRIFLPVGWIAEVGSLIAIGLLCSNRFRFLQSRILLGGVGVTLMTLFVGGLLSPTYGGILPVYVRYVDLLVFAESGIAALLRCGELANLDALQLTIKLRLWFVFARFKVLNAFDQWRRRAGNAPFRFPMPYMESAHWLMSPTLLAA